MKEANTQFALRKSASSGTSFTAVILYTVTIVASIVSAVSAVANLVNQIAPFLSELEYYLSDMQYELGVDVDLAALFDKFSSALVGSTLSMAIVAALPKILIAVGLWMILLSAKSDGPMTSAGFTMVKVIMVLNVIGLILGTVLIDAILGLMIPAVQEIAGSDEGTPALVAAIIVNTLFMLLPILFYGFAARSLTHAREIARNGGEEDDIRLSVYVGVFCVLGGVFGCIAALVLLVLGAGAASAASTVIAALADLFFGIALFKCKGNLRRADELAKPAYNPPAVVRPQAAAAPAQGAAVYPQPAPGPYGAPRKIVIRGKDPDTDSPTIVADRAAPAEAEDASRPAFCPDCGTAIPDRGKFCPRCGCRL